MKKGTKGFTLIELLVVIAIIAILSTVVMAGLNSARQKGRDAKRLADIKQLQTALELYQDSCDGYPSVLSLTDTTDGCADGKTLGDFLGSLPVNPLPGGIDYVYTVLPDATERTSYSVTFRLEGKSGSLESGDHTATPSGLQ